MGAALRTMVGLHVRIVLETRGRSRDILLNVLDGSLYDAEVVTCFLRSEPFEVGRVIFVAS